MNTRWKLCQRGTSQLVEEYGKKMPAPVESTEPLVRQCNVPMAVLFWNTAACILVMKFKEPVPGVFFWNLSYWDKGIMMHERFTDCKTLTVFCYTLSLTYCKGTATGSRETQPIHDLWREKCYCQKMPSPGDVGKCSCPQRASAHPSQVGVLFSKSRPQRWHTITSASERSEVHAEESVGSVNSQSNMGAAEPRRTSWHTPANCVCTKLSPSGHCAQSCDMQLNQRTSFQKGPESTERGQWQRLLLAQLQAAAVKNLPASFWGDAREDYPPDSIFENICWTVPGAPQLSL